MNKRSDSNDIEQHESCGVERDPQGPRYGDEPRSEKSASRSAQAGGKNQRAQLVESGGEPTEKTDAAHEVEDAPKQLSVDERQLNALISHVERHYQGPIPDPEAMRKYGEIDESFPNRMMTMAEKDQDSNIRVDERMSKAEARSFTIVSIGVTVLPWVYSLLAPLVHAPVSTIVIGAVAGCLTAGAQLVRAINGRKKESDDSQNDDSEQ